VNSGIGSSMRVARQLGLSLVEIVLTLAMVVGLLGVSLNYFTGSQRQAVIAEARFSAMTLAQMVIERMKSQLVQNPAFLRDLTGGVSPWSQTGTVVNPRDSAAGGRLQLSPFFASLFAQNQLDLYASANPVAIARGQSGGSQGLAKADVQNLVDSFRDYQVNVTIQDDVDLEPSRSGASSTLKEMIKRATVTVARSALVAARGVDPDAFTLTTRLATPTESLSSPALDELFRNFEGQSLESLWEEFFLGVTDNDFFQADYLTAESKRLLADCYIILGTINTEAYLTDGEVVAGSLLLTDRKPSQSINWWISFLSQDPYRKHPSFQRAILKMYGIRMKNQFDAYKKIVSVLQHLWKKHQEMLPRIVQISKMLMEAQSSIIQLDQKALSEMKNYSKAQTALKNSTQALQTADVQITKANQDLQSAQTLAAEADKMAAEATQLTTDAAAAMTKAAEEKKKQAAELQAAAQAALDAANAAKASAEKKIASAKAQSQESTTNLQGGMGSFVALLSEKGQALVSVYELVIVCKFMDDFFNEPGYKTVLNRLDKYPYWFGQALDASDEVLKDHLAARSGATPLDQMIAAQALVEITKIRQLFKGSRDLEALGRLNRLGDRYATTMEELSKYLKRSEVHDLDALKTRNAPFLAKLSTFKNLSAPNHPGNLFDAVVQLYRPGGRIDLFLTTYTKVAAEIHLGSNGVMSRMQRELQTMQGVTDYIGRATQDEIVKAMRGVAPDLFGF